jgi:protease IV
MSNFLRQVFATMAGVFLLGLILLFALVSQFPQTDSIALEAQTVLVLDLSAPVVDDPVPVSMAQWVGGQASTAAWPLHQLLAGLQLAGQDPNIVGIHLVAGVGDTGWANLREIRQALQKFQATGKKLSCYFPGYRERDLYLASVCDQAYLPPFSELELNGFLAELEYFRRAFDRFGIEVQVTRVGEFKAAVEPYLLDQMSAANRQQIKALLQFNFDLFLSEVAESYARRGQAQLDQQTLQGLVQERGIFTSQEAVQLGLLDGVRYQEQVAQELRSWTGQQSEQAEARFDFRQIGFSDYLAANYQADVRIDGATIAVLYAEGDILEGANSVQVGGEHLAEQLEKARLDPAIAGVVLRINSPGGSAAASEVILHQVEMLTAEKPLIISMGSVAASGGYWIASLAHEIYAQPNTITGSIGVFGMLPNVAGLAEKLGVKIEAVATGPHANLYSIYQSKSQATLDRLQVSVDQVYSGFLERVAQGRKMQINAVDEIARGRVWTGSAAADLGLVDKLGGLNDAMDRAAELAGLTDGYVSEHWIYQSSEWERLFADFVDQGEGYLASLPDEFIQALTWLRQRNARTGVYVRLPWKLNLR